jgi:acetyl-CoA carboxylase biotin carboxyl carrier protein
MSKKAISNSTATLRGKSTKKNAKRSQSSGPAASALPFAPEDFGELFDFLKEKGITEFEWSKGDQKILVKTGSAGSLQYAAAPMMAPAMGANSAAAGAAPAKEPDSYKKVLSPFVGTFYRAPSPTSPNYCDLGKKVKLGDTLCIVEAMKLMNEIEADFSGTVVKILVENGQPVEFGEPLFVIDSNG